jgi:hypothetical protein
MDESGRVVAFYIATKQMVGYSALMGKLFSVFFTKVLNHICLLIPLLYSRLPSFHISFKGQ